MRFSVMGITVVKFHGFFWDRSGQRIKREPDTGPILRATQGMCALAYVLAKGKGVIILGAGRRMEEYGT